MEKMVNVLASCDDDMLYYKGRCELQPTKVFCYNSALDGYLILRGIENAERPAWVYKDLKTNRRSYEVQKVY